MKRILCISLLCLIIFYHIRPATVGSYLLPTAEPSPNFSGSSNTMQGFAWFSDGFTLNNSSAACNFNCVFPVSGTVALNGGTLNLLQSMILADVITLPSLGSIDGNNHTLDMGASITQWPTSGGSFTDTTIICRGDIEVKGQYTFKGSCILKGQGNAFTLSGNGALLVDTNATLELEDVLLTGTKISCVAANSKLILDDVTWVQPASMNFPKGNISFKDEVKIINPGTFSYDSSQTSTIQANSTLKICDRSTLSIGRDATSWNEPLYFIDATSLLHLDNAHLITRAPGMRLTKGTVVLERGVTLDMLGSDTTQGLILGNGSASQDVTVRLVPGCAVQHDSGWWVYNNGSPNKIESASITAHLIRNTNSQIYVAQDVTLNNFTIQLLTAMVTPMQTAVGKTVLYSRAGVELPQVEFNMASTQVNYYTYLLNGLGDIFFTKGTLPFYVQVNGQGNTLRGNGGISGSVILYSNSSTLNCGINGFINNAIVLNGGTFTLDNDLKLNSQASVVGPGTIDLQVNRLTLNIGNFAANTPIYWKGGTGFIRQEGKVSLTSTWTVSGKVVFDGANNHFVFGTGGEIVVDKNSLLVLKNIELHGVRDNNIRCLDNNGVVTFLNSEWFLDGDYTFTVGAMQFYRTNVISGEHNFSYDTPQTSTVRTDGRLYFTNGLHLIIGKSGATEPLYFEDSTSTIGFDNSMVTIKPSGIQLTRGTFYGMRNLEVEVLSTSTANGLVFGNGTAHGDMRIIMDPGCTAQFNTGHVVFDVTSGNGITSKSKTAELRRGANSYFYLKRDLTLSNVTIDVNHLSTLVLDPGLFLSYERGRIVLSVGVFDLTGVRYSNTTTFLNGNHSITLINGTLPMATLVAGTGNTIDGVGNVSGPIVLNDAASSVSCGITGYLSSYVALNGGSLILSNDLNLTNGVTFQGDGRVVTGSHNLEMGSLDTSWLGNIAWSMNGSTMSLYANIDLQGTWTFSGVGEIKARGQTLSLKNGGSIQIAPGSRLTLRGVYLEHAKGSNIACLGDDSVLILDDVRWEQYDYYFTFTTGALLMRNTVEMRGKKGTFAYESNQTSTISSYSRVIFDNQFTFSYAPQSGSKDAINFYKTASLVLNSARLHSVATGMQLKKGNITIQGITLCSSDKLVTESEDGFITVVDGGITFGNGDEASDCVCTVASGGQLYCTAGSLIYKNVNPQNWIMQNDLSVLRFGPQARFLMLHNFVLDKGQVVFDDQAIFTALRGKALTGSTYAQGRLIRNVIDA